MTVLSSKVKLPRLKSMPIKGTTLKSPDYIRLTIESGLSICTGEQTFSFCPLAYPELSYWHRFLASSELGFSLMAPVSSVISTSYMRFSAFIIEGSVLGNESRHAGIPSSTIWLFPISYSDIVSLFRLLRGSCLGILIKVLVSDP